MKKAMFIAVLMLAIMPSIALAQDYNQVATFPNADTQATEIAFTPDGSLFAYVNSSNFLNVYNATDFSLYGSADYGNQANSYADPNHISANSQQVAIHSSGGVTVYDLQGNFIYQQNPLYVSGDVQYQNNGNDLAVVADSTQIYIYDSTNYAGGATNVVSTPGNIVDFDYSSDGAYLVTFENSGGNFDVFETTGYTNVGGFNAVINAEQISLSHANNDHVVYGDSQQFEVFNYQTISTFASITGVNFTSGTDVTYEHTDDGQYFVISGEGKSIFYDASDYSLIGEFSNTGSTSYQTAFSGDYANTRYYAVNNFNGGQVELYEENVTLPPPQPVPSLNISLDNVFDETPTTYDVSFRGDATTPHQEHGFVLSTTSGVDINNYEQIINNTGESTTYFGTFNDLNKDTTYYVKAYAISTGGVGYSSELTQSVPSPDTFNTCYTQYECSGYENSTCLNNDTTQASCNSVNDVNSCTESTGLYCNNPLRDGANYLRETRFEVTESRTITEVQLPTSSTSSSFNVNVYDSCSNLSLLSSESITIDYLGQLHNVNIPVAAGNCLEVTTGNGVTGAEEVGDYNSTFLSLNETEGNSLCNNAFVSSGQVRTDCIVAVNMNTQPPVYQGDYSEFPVITGTCDFCTPDFFCGGYLACTYDNATGNFTRECAGATDNNSCFSQTGLSSDQYSGNLSEFPDQVCEASDAQKANLGQQIFLALVPIFFVFALIGGTSAFGSRIFEGKGSKIIAGSIGLLLTIILLVVLL